MYLITDNLQKIIALCKKKMSFYMELESLMGRRIDLVDEEFIRNKYFREELDETKQLIYG